MSFLAAIPVIGALFDSIGNAIDKNVTSDEERLKMKAEMMTIAAPSIQAIVVAQTAFDDARFKLATAELQSGDRFIRWSRPLMSWATFGLWSYAFITGSPLTDQAFYAFGLIAGLWTATRGGEKIVANWTNGKNGKSN